MLTKQIMIQAILRRLNGETVNDIDPKVFTEPYNNFWQVLNNAAKGKGWEALAAVAGEDGIKQFINARNQDAIHYPSLAEEKDQIKPTKYDWQDWLVKGHVNMLGAYPGVGKTLLNISLAKISIHDKNFPDGCLNPNMGRPVLYVDGENFKDGILQHALSSGIDTRRFYVRSIEQDDAFLNFTLPKYQDDLYNRIYHLKPALVFLDSLSSFSLKGDKDPEEMFTILNFFDKIAVEFNITLLMVHHPRKKIITFEQTARRLDLDDFRGTSIIGAKVRVAIGISIVQTGEEEDKKGPRVMYVIKNSLGGYPELGFNIVPFIDGGVALKFGAPAKPYRKPDKAEIAAEWLENLLVSETEMRPSQIFKLGKEEDFTESDIRRARKNYLKGKITDTRASKHSSDNSWKWVSVDATREEEFEEKQTSFPSEILPKVNSKKSNKRKK